MRRETVVVVDEFLGGGRVDLDGFAVGLPVRGEDYDGFGLHFLGYFEADGLQFAVGWVGVVFEEVGSSWGIKAVSICDVFFFFFFGLRACSGR